MCNVNQLISHDRSNHHINRLRLIHICDVRLDVESPQLRLSSTNQAVTNVAAVPATEYLAQKGPLTGTD